MNNSSSRSSDNCEYAHCAKLAVGRVEAQWSCADFVRWDMCNDHLWLTYDELEHKLVDGQPVLDLGVRYYS